MTLEEFLDEWKNESQTIKVYTSGSTGKPKEITVEKARMEASARLTCDFLGLREGDTALLCMPLDYIAGKMVVVRSLVRNLRLINVPPSSHPLSDINNYLSFAAMVPLQVIRTMENEIERERLQKIENLIIGGGAIDDDLEKQLRTFPNAVWSTYGMTETLSHIALRRISGPEASLWYTPFSNVSISLSSSGTLKIYAPTVCNEELLTNDIAEINSQGQFRILGRVDNTINSGGIKIQIEEVERQIRQHLSNNSTAKHKFAITSRKDPEYGEIVVLLVQDTAEEEDLSQIKKTFDSLPHYWRPKQVIKVDNLPLTGTGKPDRAAAKKIAAQICEK